MDDLVEEVGKGFLRGIGYILAEIFFGTICYWVGWPVCKLVTLGRYPPSTEVVYLERHSARHSGFWCSVIGFLILILSALYLVGKL